MNILISIGAIYMYRYQMPHALATQFCIGGIVGGAVGNIVDRVRQGFVTDFVHVTWFPGIFNVADRAITVSVIVLILVTLRQRFPRMHDDDSILLVVDDSTIGQRLDRFVTEAVADLTRSTVQRLIEQGRIARNDKPTRAAEPLKRGDRISVQLPNQ
jgi:hypothetical protein